MLGALSLPSVSTGFTSDSKAMVPVSVQGMADKVQKMSPLDTMQEIFFDIRDGIGNLGKVFSDKISGLNSHLAFRLDKLNTTMSNIGNIAAKDLDIEQNTFDIVNDNNEEDERDESLAGVDKIKKDEGKGLFTNSFKDLLKKLDPRNLSDFGLTALAAAGVAGVIAFLGKFEKVFTFLAKGLSKAIDAGKIGFKELKKDFKNLDEGLFGKEGLVPILSSGFSDIIDGVKEGDFTKSVDGLKKILGPGVTKLVSVSGDAVIGVFDAVAKSFGYEGDALEKTQEWFRELPENIDGYVSDFLATATNVMDDLKKTYDEEGFFAASKQGAKGIFDNTYGLALNLFKDGASAIAKHYKKGEVAEELAALDFSADNFIESVKSLLDILNFDKLTQMLKDLVNSAIMSLPKILRPDTIGEQVFDTKKEIQFQKDQIAEGDTRDGFLNKREDIIKDLEIKLGELETKLPEDYKQTIESINNNESLVYKTNELKSIAQIRTETGASPVVTIMKGGDDNKNIISQGDTLVSNMRTDGLDQSTKAIEEAMK